MSMNYYLTFDEAADFLNTPRSTLYRWLREGKAPGHKLGRQWRFLRSELEYFMRSSSEQDGEKDELASLVDALQARAGSTRRTNMHVDWNPSAIAESLIWDAVDHDVTAIHITPDGAGHDIVYRNSEGLVSLHRISEAAFFSLDRYWTAKSTALRSGNKRRLYLQRDTEDSERLQVRYQKMETFSGERITLRIIRESRFPKSIKEIAPLAFDTDVLERWFGIQKGIILVAGRPGSGKTTTAYCGLEHIARSKERVIFSIEDQVEFFVPGVNQMTVDLDNEAACRSVFRDIIDSDLDVLFLSSGHDQRHSETLWGTALGLAEAGQLVIVQLEADSAKDAIERFSTVTGRDIEAHLVGAVWQFLKTDKSKRRSAEYRYQSGGLDPKPLGHNYAMWRNDPLPAVPE
jgi:excisionase family DNA binding protein